MEDINHDHDAATQGPGVDEFGDLVEDKKYRPHILKACEVGAIAEVVRYAKLGASINTQDKSGRSCLHFASMKGHAMVVRWLLTYRADVLIQDAQKKTALHMACFGGHVDVLDLLVKFSGDLQSVDIWGRTLTHAAAQKNQCGILTRLDQLDALQTTTRDVCGNSPAALATMHRYGDVSTFLDHPAERTLLSSHTHLSPRRLVDQLCPPKVRVGGSLVGIKDKVDLDAPPVRRILSPRHATSTPSLDVFGSTPRKIVSQDAYRHQTSSQSSVLMPLSQIRRSWSAHHLGRSRSKKLYPCAASPKLRLCAGVESLPSSPISWRSGRAFSTSVSPRSERPRCVRKLIILSPRR
eukprot:GEMP01027206.1.p1 GENE.GEMP01027206.1~~GEMP01027206.1.p1  ORF type:complete len:351 (+),score=60.07 GEMP01027206.1:293-1345(+)